VSEIASTTDEIEHLRQLLRDYIVDRERVEDALQESEERYRSLIARAYYGIYRSTVDGRFLEVNAALVRMLGYDSPEELMAVDIRSLYADPADREKLVRAFENGEKIPDSLDLRWVTRDGRPITVRSTAQARYRRDKTVE
jgi:two-component system, cell cycle sensor histidine kinase and response regulator CckA